MERTLKPNPVKLIFGFIFKEQDSLNLTKKLLDKHFGAIDFVSPVFDFNYTRYYEKEFGQGLRKVFVSFKKLISPEELSKIKVFSNKIERKLSKGNKRSINIDPGYIGLAKLILASTKDYCHRIYLGKGIFAEVTLVFEGKSYKPWPWTYPDYGSEEHISIFNKIRGIYAAQIKNI
ncbi:MAG: DUF4416 family protein [Candidatus Omnitrophota bacterium]